MRGPDEDGGGCGQYQEEILNYYREANPWIRPDGATSDMEGWKAYLKEKYGEEVCVCVCVCVLAVKAPVSSP